MKTKYRKLFVEAEKLAEVKMLLLSKKIAFTEQKFQYDMATIAVTVFGAIVCFGLGALIF